MDQALTPARQAELAKQRHERRQLTFLLAPGALWLVVFFMTPLIIILVFSFLTKKTYGGVIPEFSVASYAELASVSFAVFFGRSFNLALQTTLICLLAGYPIAYVIARQPSRRLRSLLLMLVIVPFWTNFVVRTYAIKAILADQGVLNSVLIALNLISKPLDMSPGAGAVLIGMVYGFLPFMILPLYASIEKFDFSLMEAAHDSGANDFWAFMRVMVPLTMPGIVAGCILVFIPSIGAYITPDILGGPNGRMLGNEINFQFTGSGYNWPYGSAISIVLMAAVSIATAIYFRSTTKEDRV